MTPSPPLPRESNPLGGRYQIVQPLAQGGFGRTFKAQDLHMPGHPFCVVKQLKPQVSSVEELQVARRLFDTEAQVLYQLGSHPQIPALLAHFEENQEFYLAQELIQGHALTEELVGQPWTEAQVVAFLGDLLGVLAFVHAKGVIHRDLKPSNLIRRREDHRIVLIDFGAVKQVSTQLHSQRSGLSHTISIGTQGYMPSEQLAGRPQFSSDLYAVGILGIQALTGYAPTDLHPHPQSGELDWRGYAPQRSPALLDFLDRLVRYDFRSRYRHGMEALAALRQLPPALSAQIPTEAIPVGAHRSSPSPVAPGQATAIDPTTLDPAAMNPAAMVPTVAVAPHRPDFPTAAVPLTHAATPRSAASPRPTWVPILALMVLAALGGGLGAVGWRAVMMPSNPEIDGGAPAANRPTPDDPSPPVPPRSPAERPSNPAPPAPTDTSTPAPVPPTPPATASETTPPEVVSEGRPTRSEVAGSTPAPPLDVASAQATVANLYVYISSGDWENAQAQFSPALAQQFDPGFFRQFDRVTVENLRVLEQSDDQIALLGENTYFYPDGTTQREERTFTVQMMNDEPRVVSSAFRRVIKFR
ncbi:hypothetical protein GFS31_14990 [Leptolyngbya sp. BL0902]|uniref:serine/threonine-protein kinase n=1 Tax=Leptolyngbya sp. BL0902 TaxID=1115757 RepID=UPI0018E8762A|nr:serine/threonine-protein kinase [Leptolyngbya sp. BL0902]QQE64817.1 hypothetical protein GFS31_14990 [Leptolyngbya sp. BL0902]